MRQPSHIDTKFEYNRYLNGRVGMPHLKFGKYNKVMKYKCVIHYELQKAPPMETVKYTTITVQS